MTKSPKRSTERTLRFGLAAAIIVFLAVGVAFFVWKDDVQRWVANDVAEIGGPFELVSHEGEAFTRDDLIGQPHILYFGFTFCPDLCPTTLFQIASVVETLGKKAAPLKVAFITVDPERDTVALLKDYVGAFHDDFIGLTGSPEAIAEATKAYRVFYRKVELEDGDYTMDHTASALLFNADGSYADAIAYDEENASAEAKIERLVETNERS